VVLLRNGYSVKVNIMKTRFAKFLAMILVMTLAFGQGMPVMSMPAMSGDQMPVQMSMDMAGMDMSASKQSSMSCCPSSDKDKTMKGTVCDTCCAAMAQTAMLPSQYAAPFQYAVAYSYDLTDTTAVSKVLPPEPPPPKA
jgi:hypothetical protein